MDFKKITALFLALIMMLSLAACGGSKNQEVSEPAKEEEAKPVKIGIVLGTGGLGDKNFNDMAYDGLLKAEADFGIEFDYLEPSSISDYVPNLRSLCESQEYALIFGLGTDMSDAITEISEDFPDQKISHIDSFLDLPNVSSVSTKWQEQTFLAGVVAGLGTLSDMPMANEDNVIGVIVGQENPSLRRGIISHFL